MRHTATIHNFIRRLLLPVLVAAAILFLLSGCGDSTSSAPENPQADEAVETVAFAGTSVASDSGTAGGGTAAGRSGGYQIPEFRTAEFHADAAQGNDQAQVDLSCLDQGYVAMRCTASAKIKFQVILNDITYTYSVVNGEDQVFPLQSGDGHYVFKVMENIADNKYAELYKCEADVAMKDPFDPFLRPNQYADYSQEAGCVEKARDLAMQAANAEGFVSSVYDYICHSVTYDDVKAASVTSGYLPDPDATMTEQKGICFDYACLTASMLRSQGIPTKIIFGYVAPNDLYHAWNMFYTEESGWTTVEFTVNPKDWNRIDLTFSANGADSSFIGDGTNYVEAYEY